MDLEILEIASNTQNNKELKKHTHLSKLKNPICGDEMQISVLIENHKIKDFGYQCKSCIYCQASVSILSRHSLNKSLKKINSVIDIAINFFDKKDFFFPDDLSDFNKVFKKKNISRKECILLPFKTLSKALRS